MRRLQRLVDGGGDQNRLIRACSSEHACSGNNNYHNMMLLLSSQQYQFEFCFVVAIHDNARVLLAGVGNGRGAEAEVVAGR